MADQLKQNSVHSQSSDGRSGNGPTQIGKSPNTDRTYRSGWKNFQDWCGGRGSNPLPADPSTVENYLRDLVYSKRTPAKSVSTARTYLAAIATIHRQAGYLDPTADPKIKSALRKMGKKNDSQILGITDEILNPILTKLEAKIERTSPGKPSRIKAQRDYALLLVMRNGMLRPSEAAELRWDDVTFLEDGSALLSLFNSKDELASQDARVPIGQSAAKAMDDLDYATKHAAAQFNLGLIPIYTDPEQRVFGLSARQISRRIKKAATDAGLHDRYSGNSLRVGMAQDLSVDFTIEGLMDMGRWSSATMPARYVASAGAPLPRWVGLEDYLDDLSDLPDEDREALLDYLAAHREISSRENLEEANNWVYEPQFDVEGPILTPNPVHMEGDRQYRSILGRAKMWRDRYEEGSDNGYEEGRRVGCAEGLENGLEKGRCEGYRDGYAKGLEQGRKEGRQNGYDEAYEDGYEKAFRAGHNAGLRSRRGLGQSLSYDELLKYPFGEGFANGLQECLGNIGFRVRSANYGEAYKDGYDAGLRTRRKLGQRLCSSELPLNDYGEGFGAGLEESSSIIRSFL